MLSATYFLEHAGAGEVAVAMREWIAAQRPRLVASRLGHPSRRAPKDARWRALVNEKVEAESPAATSRAGG
jgi:hypothetical protein